MKNKKNWVIKGLAVMTTAAIVTAGVSLTACGNGSAASASRASETTAKRVDSVVKSMEMVSTDQFNFPEIFGDEFTVTTATRTSVATTDESRPQQYSAYINKLDELYVLCADINAANEQIAQRTTEVKELNEETKELSKRVKKSKTARENFRAIENKNAEAKNSVNTLYKDRKNVAKNVKRLPNSGDNVNVEAMTVRYNAVLARLEKRLALLDEVKTDITEVNVAMRSALGESSQEPTILQRQQIQPKTEQTDTVEQRTKKIQPRRIIRKAPETPVQQEQVQVQTDQNEQTITPTVQTLTEQVQKPINRPQILPQRLTEEEKIEMAQRFEQKRISDSQNQPTRQERIRKYREQRAQQIEQAKQQQNVQQRTAQVDETEQVKIPTQRQLHEQYRQSFDHEQVTLQRQVVAPQHDCDGNCEHKTEASIAIPDNSTFQTQVSGRKINRSLSPQQARQL